MRKDNLNSKRGAAVLDRDDMSGALKDFYRPNAPVSQRVLAGAGRPTPIEFPDDADSARDDGEFLRSRNRVPVRRGLIPRSRSGRILLGGGLLVGLAAVVAAALVARSYLLHDPRFRIETSSSIQIVGNSHVTRPELLGTFGEDIDRNIFYVPLAERCASLESLPWVERATVMRLLPNRLRVAVVERTPVAFVRQGSQIGLVDAHGVLLDMPPAGPLNTLPTPHYSFPVLVGISAAEPLSTREARMKIFQGFVADLDSTGEGVSKRLSEIDLSEPEDVRALIFDKDADILVHFGDTDFLDRFHSFQSHLPEWRQQYPKLASVDMRYPRQVVLEMQPGSSAPLADAAVASNAAQPSITPPAPAPSAPETPKAAIAPKTAAPTSKPASVKRVPAKSGAGKPGPTVAKSNAADSAPRGTTPAAKPAPANALAGQAVAHAAPASALTLNASSKPPASASPTQPADPLQAADATLATRSAKPSQQVFHWIPKAAGKHSAAHPIPASQQATGGAAQ